MKPALVKIDVAAADTGLSVRRIEQLVDGGTTREKGFMWVFNLANDLNSRCRDLRFWRPELLARVQGEADKYGRWGIEQVIVSILPETREKFHGVEVDQLFQIRPPTRIAYGAELNGKREGIGNLYSRTMLAEFLERRWLGAMTQKRGRP